MSLILCDELLSQQQVNRYGQTSATVYWNTQSLIEVIHAYGVYDLHTQI